MTLPDEAPAPKFISPAELGHIIETLAPHYALDPETGELLTTDVLDRWLEDEDPEEVEGLRVALGLADQPMDLLDRVPAGPPPAPRFVIDNDEKANWAARKIAEAEAEHARILATFQSSIRDLEVRMRRELARPNRTIEFMTTLLEGYGTQVGVGPKKTRYPLGYATIKWESGRDSVDVLDAEAFVAWCRENGREDLLKFEASKSALKAALKPNEEYPGLVLRLKDGDVPGVQVFLNADGSLLPGVRMVREGHVKVTTK